MVSNKRPARLREASRGGSSELDERGDMCKCEQNGIEGEFGKVVIVTAESRGLMSWDAGREAREGHFLRKSVWIVSPRAGSVSSARDSPRRRCLPEAPRHLSRAGLAETPGAHSPETRFVIPRASFLPAPAFARASPPSYFLYFGLILICRSRISLPGSRAAEDIFILGDLARSSRLTRP